MVETPAGQLKRGDIFSVIPGQLRDIHDNPIDLSLLPRLRVESIMPVPANRMRQHNAVAQYSIYYRPEAGGELRAHREKWDAHVYLWPAE